MMSGIGVSLIWTTFADMPALNAVVPIERIKSGVLPLKTPLPAISITQISGVPRLDVGMPYSLTFPFAPKLFTTDRIQITVMAKTYPQLKQVMDLVVGSLITLHYNQDDCVVDSTLLDTMGPDVFDIDDEVYSQSVDYIVKYTPL
jgi:hypothetical protein